MKYKQEIAGLVKCPDDWDSIFPDLTEVTDSWFKIDWFYCLYKSSFRGDEARVIRHIAEYDEYVYEYNDIDWKEVRDNLAARRVEALALYRKRANRLAKLIYLPPAYNGKHYIGNNEENVVTRSIKNKDVSLFLENHSADRLRDGFGQWLTHFFNSGTLGDEPLSWSLFYDYVEANTPGSDLYSHPRAKIWRSFFNSHSVRLAFYTTHKVGYKSGKQLEHICLELEMSSSFVHAYPVSKSEAVAIMGASSDVVTNKAAWWASTQS